MDIVDVAAFPMHRFIGITRDEVRGLQAGCESELCATRRARS